MFKPLLIITLIVSIPSVAFPCLNATLLSGDEATKQVERAEKQLAEGNNKQALKLSDPHKYEFADPSLARRAELIHTVASMRLDRNPEEDLETLKQYSSESPDNPQLGARLAEAMARRADFRPKTEWDAKALSTAQAKEMRAKAMGILRDLESRDLMPDAMAFATLAQLHDRQGDAALRDAAFERCRKMTKQQNLCRLR